MFCNKLKTAICAMGLLSCTPSFTFGEKLGPEETFNKIFQVKYIQKIISKSLNVSHLGLGNHPKQDLFQRTLILGSGVTGVKNAYAAFKNVTEGIEKLLYSQNLRAADRKKPGKNTKKINKLLHQSRELFADSITNAVKTGASCYAMKNGGPLLLVCAFKPVTKILSLTLCYGPFRNFGGPKVYTRTQEFIQKCKANIKFIYLTPIFGDKNDDAEEITKE